MRVWGWDATELVVLVSAANGVWWGEDVFARAMFTAAPARRLIGESAELARAAPYIGARRGKQRLI